MDKKKYASEVEVNIDLGQKYSAKSFLVLGDITEQRTTDKKYRLKSRKKELRKIDEKKQNRE